MKIEKKHVIFGGLAVISVVLAGAYWQYTRLMNYCIGLNKIKVNAITQTKANLDLLLNFRNKSDIAINIISQEYKVYINNKFIVAASNPEPQTIASDSMSVISVNIKFNPQQSGQNIVSALLSMGNTNIKVDIKMKVKVWLFTVSIPYLYQTTIKELMIPSTNTKPKEKCV